MATPIERHADRVRRNMALIMENIVRANNCIAAEEDKKIKAILKAKNDRRLAALEQMRKLLEVRPS